MKNPTIPNRFLIPIPGAILGAALGVPISYWFQPGLMRQFVSLGNYIQLLMDGLRDARNMQELVDADDPFGILSTLRMTILVSTIIGFLLGYFAGWQSDLARKIREST